MSYPDGTLLRGDGTAVFVVDAGVRRLVPDAETFTACGFRWDLIQTVGDAELSAIPRGVDVPSAAADTPSSQGAYHTASWISPAHGGEGGAPFLDWKAAVSGRVDAVVIRTGRRVDRVQVICGASDDAHGGDGGSEQRLDLAPHEYIAAVNITLTHHTTLRVSSIAVRLNTGRMIVGGTFGDRGTYTFEAPRGHQIVGFYGRSGAEVDRLGVLAVPLGAQQQPQQHISRARAPHMAWS